MPEITLESQIGLIWIDGPENGGTPVIDYTLQYDQGSGTWITLKSEITTQQYTAIGLTAGVTYKFKVLARNVYGSSLYSSDIAVLAA